MRRSECHFKGQDGETSVCRDLCFFLEVLLQRERKPPGTELPDGPFALIQGMSVLATHCNHPKLEASLSYQVLPQPPKAGAAWTSSPVPSPQEVGTYCGGEQMH